MTRLIRIPCGRFVPHKQVIKVSDREIDIIVNGLKEKVLQRTTIAQLIKDFNEDDVHLIVERNGQFVYPQKYATTIVANGDHIEFLNPNFGG